MTIVLMSKKSLCLLNKLYCSILSLLVLLVRLQELYVNRPCLHFTNFSVRETMRMRACTNATLLSVYTKITGFLETGVFNTQPEIYDGASFAKK